MKSQKGNNRPKNSERRVNRRNRAKTQDHVTDMLRLCLQKICELQAELELEETNRHDPEVDGYTACAIETMRFLLAQGLSPGHPIVRALSERLLRNTD